MSRITALYARVSTDEQSREGYSIDTQVEKLKAYATFQGWTNIELFIDSGYSAKDMRRPEMQRLIKLIKAGRVAVVATLFVDRLSRDLLDMLKFIELCEQHKTAYVCASLNFDTSTPIGRMVLQILAAFAEFERAMISTRVKDNMKEIAEKHKRYLAVPPFGYEFNEEKELVIVPDEAEWVRKAADMFVAGYGYRSVAKFLNENEVKTRKGVAWSASTVRQMLTNELYIGTVIWNRRYYDKQGRMHWRDESEWIVQENAHPAVFSKEQWTEINKRIKRKVPRGGQRQSKYRLSGLVHCAYCGSKMVSRRYGNKGPHRNRFIFVCSNYQKNGGCRFNYVFVDDAEDEVYQTIEKLSNGLINVSEEQLGKASEAYEQEFKRREAAIDQKFQRQIQAYENGLISDRDLKIARERVEKERELLNRQKERAMLPKKNDIVNVIKKEAKQILWLWKNGELEVVQNSLRLLIERIVSLDGKIIDIELSRDLFLPEF